jgi:hypothetical protein
MKRIKELFEVVRLRKASIQICTFDAKTGWGKADYPFPDVHGPLAETHESVVRELRKTHEPFWGSCECCSDEGVILYRPRCRGRQEWLAYVKGRAAYELVLLSNLGAAMEFVRLYAPALISIPDNHRVPGILEEALDRLEQNLEPSLLTDIIQ